MKYLIEKFRRITKNSKSYWKYRKAVSFVEEKFKELGIFLQKEQIKGALIATIEGKTRIKK